MSQVFHINKEAAVKAPTKCQRTWAMTLVKIENIVTAKTDSVSKVLHELKSSFAFVFIKILLLRINFLQYLLVNNLNPQSLWWKFFSWNILCWFFSLCCLPKFTSYNFNIGTTCTLVLAYRVFHNFISISWFVVFLIRQIF